MALMTDNDISSDDELQELELQQRQLDIDREHKQRQLDIDRKKTAIRKRRANLQPPVDATPPPGDPTPPPADPTPPPVDLTPEDTEPPVKAEPEGDLPPRTSPEPTRVPLPSPALTEATQSVPISSAVPIQEPTPDLEHNQHDSEEGPSSEAFTEPEETRNVATTSIYANAASLLRRPYVDIPPVPKPCSPPTSAHRPARSMSQATSPDTSTEIWTWQYDGFGCRRLFPSPASTKRSRSPEARSTVETGNEESPSIVCKRVKYTKGQSDEPGAATAKQHVETRTPTVRHKYEILREYGRRLVNFHMRKFHDHDHDTAELLMYAGSKVTDGLVEGKYKNLEELHDEYEHHLGTYYSYRVPEYVQLKLQKIRQAAPIWWERCLKLRYHHQRLALAGTVLGEVRHDQGRDITQRADFAIFPTPFAHNW